MAFVSGAVVQLLSWFGDRLLNLRLYFSSLFLLTVLTFHLFFWLLDVILESASAATSTTSIVIVIVVVRVGSLRFVLSLLKNEVCDDLVVCIDLLW